MLDRAEKYIFATVFLFFAYRVINGYIVTASAMPKRYGGDDAVPDDYLGQLTYPFQNSHCETDDEKRMPAARTESSVSG